MNRTIILILALIVVVSCNKKQEESNNDSKAPALTKKEFYLSKMKEKNFHLEMSGPCDDALEDTIHERSVAYFDSKTQTDSNLIVEFKFKDTCCQEYLGDYSIEDDTLQFKYEQVNNEACDCLCWYRYKLTINEPNKNYKEIKIEEK